MLAMSSWLLLVFGGLGYVSWIGFLIIGVVARRAHWLIAAGVYLVAMVLALLAQVLGWPVSVSMSVIWGISVLHAVLVNSSWLRYIWGRRMERQAAAYLATTRTAPRPNATTHSTAAADGMQVDTSVPHTIAATNQLHPATATVEQLESVPFMGRERAEYLVRYREGQRLDSIEDLIAFLNLQPHEAVAMRTRLTFDRAAVAQTPQATPRSQPTDRAATGRILDV